MDDYVEFMAWLNSVPKEEMEPFCPFNDPWFKHGYCDVAYSESCFNCEFRKEKEE